MEPTDAAMLNPLNSLAGLRLVIVILFHPSMRDPDTYPQWDRVMRLFRALTNAQRDVLANWLAGMLKLDEFREMLEALQQYRFCKFSQSAKARSPY